MSERQDIPIASIHVRDDRARPVDGAHAEALAGMIEAVGLLQPIVVRKAGDEFELIAGNHRLAACRSLQWDTIPVSLVEADDTEAALFETLENLARNELSALDRARHFAKFKSAYEAKYGQVERGGDRKSKSFQNQSAEPAFWSFHETIADRTGFSRRTVFAYVAVWNGLDPRQCDRLQLLPKLAGNFGQLKLLSEQSHDTQDQVLCMIEGDSQAATVAEALELIAEGRLKQPAETVVSRAIGACSRLNEQQRFVLFDNMEADVRAYAIERGWTKP